MSAPVGVVLVHGVRTSHTMWRAQVEALEATGRPVRAIDLPGHGADAAGRFSVDATMARLEDAVQELGGEAVVAGLSLGGYLAIEYLRRRPHAVRALVAAGCCTVPSTPARGLWLSAVRWIERLPDAGAGLNETMVRRLLSPQAAQDVAAGGYALGVMSDVLTEVGDLDPLAGLRAARGPVWLVNGRLDHFRGQERAFVRAARASRRPVRLVVVPGARHLVSLDAPVAFTRVLLEALDVFDGSSR
ncbi:MAG: alpha/beta fold hydrolase [Cellulomonadaceae bacterium]